MMFTLAAAISHHALYCLTIIKKKKKLLTWLKWFAVITTELPLCLTHTHTKSWSHVLMAEVKREKVEVFSIVKAKVEPVLTA